jgi:hypothetical protein
MKLTYLLRQRRIDFSRLVVSSSFLTQSISLKQPVPFRHGAWMHRSFSRMNTNRFGVDKVREIEISLMNKDPVQLTDILIVLHHFYHGGPFPDEFREDIHSVLRKGKDVFLTDLDVANLLRGLALAGFSAKRAYERILLDGYLKSYFDQEIKSIESFSLFLMGMKELNYVFSDLDVETQKRLLDICDLNKFEHKITKKSGKELSIIVHNMGWLQMKWEEMSSKSQDSILKGIYCFVRKM